MSNSEEQTLDPRSAAVTAKIEAGLTAFDRHRDELLAILQKACERTPKIQSFDKDDSWDRVRYFARAYLQRAAEKMSVRPAADRAELLGELGAVLGEAHRKISEVVLSDVRGCLFVEWCEAHGNPEFTDSIIDRVDTKFGDVVADLVAGLADLETAAFRAAEEARRPPGRPRGTSVLRPEFIFYLESVYKISTGKTGGAGRGPFVRFVMKFLEALSRKTEEQTVIKAIKAGRRTRKISRRSLLAAFRGKNSSESP
jgi:hypothetical protein